MRRALPIFIVIIGLLALVIDFWPGLRLPSGDPSNPSRVVESKLGLGSAFKLELPLVRKTVNV